MTEAEALALLKSALEKVQPGASEKVTMDTDLVGDDIVDSLDSMNFLFELEGEMDNPIAKIDEDFNDFRVKTLVDLIVAESS
jgi:acyl carrier protein